MNISKKSMRGVIDPYGLGFIVILIGGLFINSIHDKTPPAQSKQDSTQSIQQLTGVNRAGDK